MDSMAAAQGGDHPLMGIEIERRFLVKDLSWFSEELRSVKIVQNYLSSDPARVVRVRLSTWDNRPQQAFLTIKGYRDSQGSCSEFEYQISVQEALEMQEMAPVSISKRRYHIPVLGNLTWEVDLFGDRNFGLVLAEIELPSPDYPVYLPPWLGREVTTEPAYSNVSLALRPYSSWSKEGQDCECPESPEWHRMPFL